VGNKTGIAWTNATWNPIRGCSRISRGCVHCYAETVAHRFSGPGQPYEGLLKISVSGRSVPVWNGTIYYAEEHLLDPLRWQTPRRIFTNSMSDLFHENLSDAIRDRIFAVMLMASRHHFQVLTKRPAIMRAYMRDAPSRIAKAVHSLRDGSPKRLLNSGPSPTEIDGWFPLANVALGVSVEDQDAADNRIPELMRTPAALRFISAEPLLSDLNLDPFLAPHLWHDLGDPPVSLDWVIAGGESGNRVRFCDIRWLRSIVAQCMAERVPVFVKQLGSNPFDGPTPFPVRASKGDDPGEWPEDLRVQQYPTVL
jgi:protein gp37